MLEPAVPLDEDERLADLCRLHVLDSAPEARFDQITRTAQRLFSVPIALISLIDTNRQWFKSRQGLDAPETPRNISFCGHAILQEGAFIIPDAATDPRFADNPLVTADPHIRFYAGMPLHGMDGHRIGTLCLIDRVPRSFDEDDISALTDLSAWAELQLNIYTVESATALARDKEERLQAILDHAGDAIITVAEDGTVRSFNREAVRVFGHSTSQVVGCHVAQLLQGATISQVNEYMAAMRGKTLGTPGSLKREVLARRADGSSFAAEMTVTRLRSGAEQGFTGILRDISERKKIDRMKNDFISTVSHELRTPLTSISGALGLVRGGATGGIPAPAQELLGIAASNCDRLVRLINDMLDIEKIESGSVRFAATPQALMPLVQQALAATETFATQFEVSFTVDDLAPRAQVMADADRLVQVIVNLLSNAAKFSERGGLVQLQIGRNEGPTPVVRLTVSDRGRGIPAAFRSQIFSRFAQADASDVRQKAGTGLGLSISRAIVEQMNGRIGFVDREGGGTEFFVELPELPDPAARASLPAAGTVLVCEDDPDIARLLGLLLERSGVSSDLARDANEARAMLAAHDYRAMTLDIGLPGEDGLSLLQWLRSRPETADLPVVVVSARETADAIGSGGAFGALDWISKPIETERLLGAVRAAIRGPREVRPVVLYVEDDFDLSIVVRALLRADCDVVHAPTLAEARAALNQRAFDLILLDMELPDGCGSDLLVELAPHNAATPVVIFSGNEVSRDVSQRVKNALVKARTSNAQLLAAIQRLLPVKFAQK